MTKTISEKIAKHKAEILKLKMSINKHEKAIWRLRGACEHTYRIDDQSPHWDMSGSTTFSIRFTCTKCEVVLYSKKHQVPRCVSCPQVDLKRIPDEFVQQNPAFFEKSVVQEGLAKNKVGYQCPNCKQYYTFYHHGD